MFEYIIYMIFQFYRIKVKNRKSIYESNQRSETRQSWVKNMKSYSLLSTGSNLPSESTIWCQAWRSSISLFSLDYFEPKKCWTQYSLWTTSSWVLRILSPCFPFRFSLQMVLWAAVPIRGLCMRLLIHLQAPITEIWWTRLLSPNQKPHRLRLSLPRKVIIEVSWLAELSSFQMLNKCSILWYCSSFLIYPYLFYTCMYIWTFHCQHKIA